MKTKQLLSFDTNAKTVKGQKLGVATAILYLAPFTQAGLGNVCSSASAGCAAACLYSAGRGKFKNVEKARIDKTKLFFASPSAFVDNLKKNVTSMLKKAAKLDMKLAVRLNGTSDLMWERIKGSNGKTIMEEFADVQFYDYTKHAHRALAFTNGKLPSNYHITFSRSEEEKNHKACLDVLANGGNVAMVFDTKKGKELPQKFNGYKVIDGDLHDVRFTDSKNVVVGLRAKGDARKDTSGFVFRTCNK